MGHIIRPKSQEKIILVRTDPKEMIYHGYKDLNIRDDIIIQNLES